MTNKGIKIEAIKINCLICLAPFDWSKPPCCSLNCNKEFHQVNLLINLSVIVKFQLQVDVSV